jgi:rhodanese-related sulfurtransferase
MSNTISSQEFKDRLSELTILDIRTPDEIADFPIGGITILFEELMERLDLLEPYKNQELVVVCYTGLQSKIACTILKKRGFLFIKNLEGGLEAFLSL